MDRCTRLYSFTHQALDTTGGWWMMGVFAVLVPPTLCGICCEFQVKTNPRAFIYNPALAINLGWHIGTKINIIHSMWVCVLSVQLMHVCDAPNASLNDSSLSFGADMDHRRSLLPCCCSPSDNSVQLDHRSCSHSQLASGGWQIWQLPKAPGNAVHSLLKNQSEAGASGPTVLALFLSLRGLGAAECAQCCGGKIKSSRGPSVWL